MLNLPMGTQPVWAVGSPSLGESTPTGLRGVGGCTRLAEAGFIDSGVPVLRQQRGGDPFFSKPLVHLFSFKMDALPIRIEKAHTQACYKNENDPPSAGNAERRKQKAA